MSSVSLFWWHNVWKMNRGRGCKPGSHFKGKWCREFHFPSPPLQSVITEGGSRVHNVKQILSLDHGHVSNARQRNLIDHKTLMGRDLFCFAWLQCGKDIRRWMEDPRLPVTTPLLWSRKPRNQGGVKTARCCGNHTGNKNRFLSLFTFIYFDSLCSGSARQVSHLVSAHLITSFSLKQDAQRVSQRIWQ